MLNKDYKLRDSILGFDYHRNYNDIIRFDGLNLESFEKLVKNNFIDMEGYQNESPTNKEFFDFMKMHPEITCHGYAVSPERKDYRVSVIGMEYSGEKVEEYKEDFKDFAIKADDLIFDDKLFCYWD